MREYFGKTAPNIYFATVSELLDTPTGELRRLWDQKRVTRAAFVERYVLGSRNGGRGLWSWLWGVRPVWVDRGKRRD